MGKVREFAELFERFDLEVKSLHDFPHIEEVEETGETFEENAILKADSLSRQLNAIVIADDSGLIVVCVKRETRRVFSSFCWRAKR